MAPPPGAHISAGTAPVPTGVQAFAAGALAPAPPAAAGAAGGPSPEVLAPGAYRCVGGRTVHRCRRGGRYNRHNCQRAPASVHMPATL